ncbi:MAG: Nif3-like dinuclear metal center hexameric protein, partial [Thermoanaerobaculia bacterium]|nr:Nif3-like dinuclear metal center hexameric protein [Thermoanaerobaculia bacterium]
AVSAGQELFDRAAASGADLVLVHHGLFWKGEPRTLVGVRRRRVATLLESGLNLVAYHLPLDRHPELGNNALAARRLGLTELRPFGRYGGVEIGVRGRFEEPLPAAELVARCKALVGQEPLALGARGTVASLAVVSGAAADFLHEAAERGIDAFLTGEPREWVKNLAEETGTLFLACGHYATERLGVLALGERLAERFGVEVEFVDLPNPV